MITSGESDQLLKAASLVGDMIVMAHRFENELTSEKGIGRVFDQVTIYIIFKVSFYKADNRFYFSYQVSAIQRLDANFIMQYGRR